MIELYTAASGNGRRATIMIEECGLDYTLHPVEIGSGAHKPPEFLRLNPQATIPMIVDRDGPSEPMVLVQSGAILLYLARKTGKFLPAKLRDEAITCQWLMFALTDVVGANTAMYLAGGKLGHQPAAEFFQRELVDYLTVCDDRLARSEYLALAEPTIADFALFPVTVSRRSIIVNHPGLDNLKRWIVLMDARPAIHRALAAIV